MKIFKLIGIICTYGEEEAEEDMIPLNRRGDKC